MGPDFKTLLVFLDHEYDISKEVYLVSEYLLRAFLKQQNDCYKFRYETLDPDCTSIEDMIRVWIDYEKRTPTSRWGLEPLVPSGLIKDRDLESINRCFEEVLAKIPRESRVKEIRDLRLDLERSIEITKRNVREIKRISERVEYWQINQRIYLVSSKLIMQELFGDLPRLNKFIALKKQCYFKAPPVRNLDSFRQTLTRAEERNFLEQELKKYLDHPGRRAAIKSAMARFRTAA
jgi:hypothetical protein